MKYDFILIRLVFLSNSSKCIQLKEVWNHVNKIEEYLFCGRLLWVEPIVLEKWSTEDSINRRPSIRISFSHLVMEYSMKRISSIQQSVTIFLSIPFDQIRRYPFQIKPIPRWMNWSQMIWISSKISSIFNYRSFLWHSMIVSVRCVLPNRIEFFQTHVF